LVDGIIVQSTGLNEDTMAYVIEGNIPYVVAGRPTNAPNSSYVDVDNVAGAHKATMHIIQLGRKRIATITGALDTSVGIDRLDGYRKAMNNRRIDINERFVAEGDFTELSSYYATKRLIAHSPDAIFVASDSMATGVMRALREEGISVPKDIAIVGFDDLPPAKNSIPPLTTVRQPVRKFGNKLVETLLDILNNGSEPARKIIFDTELVIRESCGMHSSSE